MDTLEIEVKFFLSDVDATRHHLVQTGTLTQERCFEHNSCFETADKRLLDSHSLLRLRKDRQTTLTYKTKPNVEDPGFKILEELEVEVSQFDTMLSILDALGFHRSQVYEKYRETFTIGPAKVCIDGMPFGNFLEIEGGKDEIRRLAQQMGMQWHKRIVYNYRSMFDIIKKRLNLPFSDITFDNFSHVALDIETFLPQFEAGNG